jgi:hypothetical protein
VRVNGGVRVGKDAVLAVGCSEAMTQDPFISFLCPNGVSTVKIRGGLRAHAPKRLVLDGVTINGRVISTGGSGPDLNFVFKDNTVHGSVTLTGWTGGWNGMIRNTVSGNVIYSNNVVTDPDGNEIVHNTVGGKLACFNNVVPAQFGDAGSPPYAWNTVHGRALGECAALVE